MAGLKAEAGMNHVEAEEEAYHFAMQLTTAYALPMTLKSALELNLLETISRNGPNVHLSAEEIVTHLPTSNPDAAVKVERILRLLASYGLVTCITVNDDGGKICRRYGVAPAAKYLLRNEDGESIWPFLLVSHDKVAMEAWHFLTESVISGGVPFNKAYGMNIFEYIGTDSRFNEVFNAGLSSPSSITMKKILQRYDGFEGLGVVVDVGGGIGSTLKMILSKYPHVKGVNFDLAHVIARAPAISGIEHVAGDMFESVPQGNAMILKWVLHDWSDELCVKVLKNCWKALPKEGKVVVIEGVLPESPNMTRQEQWLLNIDMFMLSVSQGGRERTEMEYKSLGMAAGFSALKNHGSVFGACIMEFTKSDSPY